MKDMISKLNHELNIMTYAFHLACRELSDHANDPRCNMPPISNRGVSATEDFILMLAEHELRLNKEELDNDS